MFVRARKGEVGQKKIGFYFKANLKMKYLSGMNNNVDILMM